MRGLIWWLALSGVCLGGWLVAPMAGRAATQMTQSQIEIKITPSEDDSAVKPVDPDEPSKPYPGDDADPGNVDGTGSRGNLTIDYLSNLKFNNITVASGPTTTTAKNQKAMVQISDRRATGSGWTLQVLPSAPRNGQQALAATIDLGSVEIKPATTNVSTAPQLVNEGHLTAGSVNNVLKADQQAGLGTWLLIMNRGSQPTTLHLADQKFSAGHYTGTLTWSLTNAPS
ncbi:WxL domain-containing protein [Lactiplantibacillus sp. WILCCON 0030]|uniref:WxL domain-containing protein n=1 Tax=Lactiplantibacillus brownii TaxID=3069269 RepID=A0ABU1ACC9_9LACO|nr:WxL domain-containing protein [Lactiplantibacillus brownii]MDQ7938616.1 WxL domain-containing protein [Lactiplantibacillus brownii]